MASSACRFLALVVLVADSPAGFAQQLSSGYAHTCKVGGYPECWGLNAAGQGQKAGYINTVNGLKGGPSSHRPVVIAAGYVHTCVLHDNFVVVCWGGDHSRQVSATPKDDRFITIAAGRFFTCGILRKTTGAGAGRVRATGTEANNWYDQSKDLAGGVKCWGSKYGKLPPADQLEGAKAIAAGGETVCIIRKTGTALCWGRDDYKQATPPRNVQLVSIAVGITHACGITPDRGVLCWGNDAGKGVLAPPSGVEFVQVAVN